MSGVEFDFGPILAPWKDFGTVIKGELKRSIININQFLLLTLGPTMAGADIAKVLKKNREKIRKIDRDVDAALDKVPIPGGFKAAAFIANPGLGLAVAVRAVHGEVTPDAIEKFSEEYGFKDLKIGRFPIGSLLTWSAKKASKAGGYVTFNVDAMADSEKDEKEKAKDKWYTPIERIFLLQRPFTPMVEESKQNYKSLLTEAENNSAQEEKAFIAVINNHPSMQKYYDNVGVAYIQAHTELADGLLDAFENELQDISNISSAKSFQDFVEAIESAKTDKFKSFNTSSLKKGMIQTAEDIMGNEEEYGKFLKAAKKNKSEIGNEKQALDFMVQKIYEKEFSSIRQKSIESIGNGVEEIKDAIYGSLEDTDLDSLKGTPIGNQLHDIIQSAKERLDTSTEKLSKMQSNI
tara:strand:+ start:5221 stop:6441 length:1221 start_codon:yes stop_codon:yes gene_type:complete